MQRRAPAIPEGDDATIRAAVLTHLMQVLRADAGASARMVVDAGRVMGLGLVAFGSEAFLIPRQKTQGVPLQVFHLDLDTTWSFGQFKSETFDNVTPEVRQVYWTDAGMHDALGMYVRAGGRFLGYISVYRAITSPVFTDQDLGLANSLAPWVTQAFEKAIVSDDAQGLVAGRFVFDATGSLRFGSPAQLSPHATRTVGRCAQAFMDGSRLGESILGDWRLSMTRLDGPDGRAALVEVRRVYSGLVPEAMTLTPIKRRIAAYAARGATAGDIATVIGRHPETVRAHLKEIYDTLQVSSRVELADACRALWSSDEGPLRDTEPEEPPKDA